MDQNYDTKGTGNLVTVYPGNSGVTILIHSRKPSKNSEKRTLIHVYTLHAIWPFIETPHLSGLSSLFVNVSFWTNNVQKGTTPQTCFVHNEYSTSTWFSSPVECLETPQESPQNIIRLGLPTHARRPKLPSGMFNHVAPMDAGQHDWSPNMIPICVSWWCLLIQKALYTSFSIENTNTQALQHSHFTLQTCRLIPLLLDIAWTLLLRILHWPSGYGIPAVL